MKKTATSKLVQDLARFKRWYVSVTLSDAGLDKKLGSGIVYKAETKEDAIKIFWSKNPEVHKEWATYLADGAYIRVSAHVVPFLTPREVLALKELPDTDSYRLFDLFGLSDYHYDWERLEYALDREDTPVRLVKFVDVRTDSRRGVLVGALYYKTTPVCLYSRAGRELDDQKWEWWFDKSRALDVLLWMAQFRTLGEGSPPRTDLDQEIPKLSHPYGIDLETLVEITHEYDGWAPAYKRDKEKQ